ncbi:TRAP transporter small permease [Brachybacterium sp.]|uniref:TRAP transporter small permease n=1 Tax=Brachybacterium sp. TaxID=1891286 RepID=UPI003F929800
MRFIEAALRVVVGLCATALAVMVVVVAIQVLGRYAPFVERGIWTEEISRMALVWLVFLGAAAGVRTSEHFLIDLLPNTLGNTTQRVLSTIGLAMVAIVTLALFVGSISFAHTGLSRISTATGIPLFYSYLAAPVSMVLVLLFSAQAWWEAMIDPSRDGLRSRDAVLA